MDSFGPLISAPRIPRAPNHECRPFAKDDSERIARDARVLMSLLDWIEAHPVFVDLGKAVVVLVIAWFAGLGRFLVRLARKCRVWVVEPVSRCYLEDLGESHGVKDPVRASFLLSVGVTNPTTEKVVVEAITLQFESKRAWRPRSSQLDAVSLPSRPRVTFATSTKVSRTWFINYGDDAPASLTAHGRIEARDTEDAYILFVSATYGSWNPRVENDHVRIWVSARLTTGETMRTSTKIPTTKDMESFEKRVPGVREHVASDGAWNISLRDWRRGLRRSARKSDSS
jgi:hypothetical protein